MSKQIHNLPRLGVKYDAFISYHHATDGELGPAVRDGLHRFARPWYRLRALRVFCDVRSVAATESLWPTVEHALNDSRCLVLLASPQSAESVWVRREVEHWQRHEPRRPIHVMLTGGEIAWNHDAGDFDWDRTTALPPSLRGWFPEEPLWVDLLGATPKGPKSLDGIVTLSAALHGQDKDDLIGEDVAQHRKVTRFRRLAWAGLSALTVLALVAATVAFVQRSNAIEQRDTALANQLVLEATTVQDTQPGLARQLIAAAHQLKPTPQVESAVLGAGVIPQELHENINTLAYSADGKILAAARSGRPQLAPYPEVISHIWLYDTETLGVLSEWSLDSRLPIHTLAFSPDGHRLAVGHSKDIDTWDITNPHAPIKGATITLPDSVESLAFGPRGVLASGSRDGVLRLWHGTNPLWEQRIADPDTLWFTVRFAGTLLATLAGSYDSTVRLWDVSGMPRPVGEPITGVQAFDFAPDGTQMIVRVGQELRVQQVGGAPRTLPVSGGVRPKQVLHGRGNQVAAVCEDGFVRIWDAAELALVAELPMDAWEALNTDAVTFSPSGTSIAIATPGSNAGSRGQGVQSGTVRIWNVADARERRAIGALRDVSSFAVSGQTLATVGGKSLRLWDLSALGAPLSTTALGERGTVAFGQDGTTLAVGNKTLRIFDVRDPRQPRVISSWAAGDDWTMAYNGRYLATGFINTPIYLHEIGHPGVVGEIPVVSVSYTFLPDRPALVLANGLGTNIDLWDITNPAQPFRLDTAKGTTYEIQDVAFASGVLASASRDGSVRLWRADSKLTEITAITDSGDVNRVAVSPSGHRVATLGRDRTIRVYDLAGSQAVPALVMHVGAAAQTIGLVRDDLMLVSTSHDVVDLWDLNVPSALRRLCSGVGAPITPEQWTRVLPDLPYRQPCKARKSLVSGFAADRNSSK